MCDICKSAASELRTFLTGLEDRYPGTTVEGTPVAPTHHVFVAIQVAAEIYAAREAQFMVEQLAKDKGLTVEQFIDQHVAGGGPVPANQGRQSQPFSKWPREKGLIEV